jgi:hypothetical protein
MHWRECLNTPADSNTKAYLLCDISSAHMQEFFYDWIAKFI